LPAGLVFPAPFIMVVGHEGVWIMSRFLGKREDRHCKEREEKLSSPAFARQGTKKHY